MCAVNAFSLRGIDTAPVGPTLFYRRVASLACKAGANHDEANNQQHRNGRATKLETGTSKLQPRYQTAERVLHGLIRTPDLDEELRSAGVTQANATELRAAVEEAKSSAYSTTAQGADTEAADAAHLFLQRLLYRINRMVFFWFDDLNHYDNERSVFLAQLRNDIEEVWQAWEDRKFRSRASRVFTSGVLPGSPEEVGHLLRQYAKDDVSPSLSAPLLYIRDELSLAGYKHLLAIASLDGLVEASRQSRVCGGVGNSISCAVFRVLTEEYGNGRMIKKHSTVFGRMMEELGLDSSPEHFFDSAPWQLLRSINHNFLLTERRRHYLRYLGGLTFFELSGPSVYKAYLGAAERLGLGGDAASYWELHIREDERHGAQMLSEVALPLVDIYPQHAHEVLAGYLQEKWMGEDASRAIVEAIQGQEDV